MCWGVDMLNSKMDNDADYYEKEVKPRGIRRMLAIFVLYPELSAEDLQDIRHDIDWLDSKELRKKLDGKVKNKKGR